MGIYAERVSANMINTTRTLDPNSPEGRWWAAYCLADAEALLGELRRARAEPLAWYLDQLGDA